jgi:hypothetical protein
MESINGRVADPLMLEFLSWISSRPRTYADAMNAWQSTCPRHTIWEDAITDGLVQLNGAETLHDPEVTLTPRGKAYLHGNTPRQ